MVRLCYTCIFCWCTVLEVGSFETAWMWGYLNREIQLTEGMVIE